jgi:two-component system, NtrC family, sensor histidine kinase KinB
MPDQSAGPNSEEAQQQEKGIELDEFISLVSHEFRAPLTVISGYAQLLSRKLNRQGLPSEAAYADLIREQAARMVNMATDVAELTRFESGIVGLKLEPIDIAEQVQIAVQKFKSELSTSVANEITTIIDKYGLVSPIDSKRFNQVITNLLTNAVKYSPEGGGIEVNVKAAPEADKLRVQISDRGIGVSPEERERVFDRGYRGARAKALVAQGLGLGLYICRLVVEAHGGKIGVEDGPEGKGSCFYFTVPAGSASAAGGSI